MDNANANVNDRPNNHATNDPAASPAAPDAAQLLALALERFSTDIHAWLDLIAEDAVVEFPYSRGLGTTPRLEGKPAIAAYFTSAIQAFRDLTFRDVRLHPGRDPSVAIAEAHGTAIIAPTGKRYEQDYVMVVRARGGRIVEYREYWNPLPALEAFGGASAASATRSGS